MWREYENGSTEPNVDAPISTRARCGGDGASGGDSEPDDPADTTVAELFPDPGEHEPGNALLDDENAYAKRFRQDQREGRWGT